MPATTDVDTRPMAKKSAKASPQTKTIKCSEATYQNVRKVAALRDIDMADYVDQVLGPIAERDAKAEGRKLAGN